MTSELETWRQQEAKYIKLLSDHAESTKKAGEDIPEAKTRLAKVQSKIDTAAKDINEVRLCNVLDVGCNVSDILSHRPSRRKPSSSNELEISIL